MNATKRADALLKKSRTSLERAKKKYFRIERELQKAEAALSNAYKDYDDQIRCERMVKKLGYDPRFP